MNLKTLFTRLATLSLLIGPMVAHAIPMTVVVNEDGFGGSGRSWVGTFDAGEVNPDGMYSVVTNFQIVIDGTAYNQVNELFGLLLFYSFDGSAPMLSGALNPEPFAPTVLQFDASYFNDIPAPRWALSPCSENGCGGGAYLGTYSVLPGLPGTTVPEPTTLALFCLGLAGVAARSRCRKREIGQGGIKTLSSACRWARE